MNFKRINNITGWAVFFIAFFVYLKTMEPTGSLWDCGEFASSAYKIQLPHPPGAPLFVLLGRLFMIPFDPQHAALGVNAMSAMASAFTILFLFWSITHFARKIASKSDADNSEGNTFIIMAAGAVGALAYTFSDSFWFSAVEGEVYALSSFFTAIVFWAGLKWEQSVTEEKANGIHGHFTKADRWLILIFYLMGLSIGVHLLNLLTIPAIIMIYYFKRYNPTVKGSIFAFIIGCIITGIVQKAVIQWSIKGAGMFDVWFVNSMGLPFFSGFTFFFILFALLLAIGIYMAQKMNLNFLKLSLWSVAFITLGFSTYLTTMIRSNANPSIDMYNVDNPVSLVGYLTREQYGDWPILYGNDFTERPPQKLGSEYYTKGTDGYHPQGQIPGYAYADAENAHIFPRMWDFNDDRNSHTLYKNFGKLEEGEDPTMLNNISYFMGYQMGVMYLRYFMWNFAGRQNDVQGFGNARDGNFISGITPIDNMLTGSKQQKMPDSIGKNNKAENKLYFLPLILGLMGCIYQINKSKKDWLINTLFFFFTGIAIVIYLNQYGYQPRERDYAYVGSFYAFAIWIGLGVMMVYDLLKNAIKNAYTSQWVAGMICMLAVPVLMGFQEWDDHDRSNKTIARDLAIDYLESCPQNAILITFGDNDTYPLWYAQEVEGIRTDIRVINYSLLGSDWYYTQIGHKVNNSEYIDAVFSDVQVEGKNREVVAIKNDPSYSADKYYNLLDELKNYTGSDDQSKKVELADGNFYSALPTKKYFIPVDSAIVSKDSSLKSSSPFYSQLNIDIAKDVMYKNDLAVLAIIAANKWKRPICFTSPGELQDLGLAPYLELQGMCYRFVPYKSQVNKNWSYKVMTEKFKFGNADKDGVYFDEVNRGHLLGIRQSFAMAISYIVWEAENGRQMNQSKFSNDRMIADSTSNMNMARNLLKIIDKGISDKNVPYGITCNTSRNINANSVSATLYELAIKCGEKELAERIKKQLLKDVNQQLSYYQALGNMSSDQLIENLNLATRGMESEFNNKQASFIQEMLTCLKIKDQIQGDRK